MQSSLDTVLARLDALERQNRRLRSSGLALALLVAGILTLGATLTPPTNSGQVPDLLQARDLQLLDSYGELKAELSLDSGTPMLALYDRTSTAEPPVLPNGNGVLDMKKGDGEIMVLVGNGISGISMQGNGLHLDMNDRAADRSVYLQSDELGKRLLLGGGLSRVTPVQLSFFHEERPLQFIDSAGFETDLGVTGTITPTTGEHQQTSTASMVMFGNDKLHHVIWEAPVH